MIQINFNSFFDRDTVLRKVKDGTKSSLAKFGSYVRTRARRSIRQRKKSAQPGSPPSSHTRLLRDFIFFGYDDRTDSVVVGPALMKQQTNPTIPNVLEKGGTLTHWKTGKPAVYRAFPFMEPALSAESEKFVGLFSGVVK
jgi:hypothetical protein